MGQMVGSGPQGPSSIARTATCIPQGSPSPTQAVRLPPSLGCPTHLAAPPHSAQHGRIHRRLKVGGEALQEQEVSRTLEYWPKTTRCRGKVVNAGSRWPLLRPRPELLETTGQLAAAPLKKHGTFIGKTQGLGKEKGPSPHRPMPHLCADPLLESPIYMQSFSTGT